MKKIIQIKKTYGHNGRQYYEDVDGNIFCNYRGCGEMHSCTPEGEPGLTVPEGTYEIVDKFDLPKQYILAGGRRVFIRSGLGSEPTYKAFFQYPHKNAHALSSTRLPWRDTEARAQADLDALIAEGKGIFKGAATVGVDCKRLCGERNLCTICHMNRYPINDYS